MKGTADTAGSVSEEDSLEDNTFEFGSPDQLQTFFDPKTGAKFTLTPGTSIYSDGRDTESENMHSSDEQVVEKVGDVSQGRRDAFQKTYILKQSTRKEKITYRIPSKTKRQTWRSRMYTQELNANSISAYQMKRVKSWERGRRKRSFGFSLLLNVGHGLTRQTDGDKIWVTTLIN